MLSLARNATNRRAAFGPARFAAQARRSLATVQQKPRKSTESSMHKQTLPERFSMKGKTCVVTGAAQGLGFEFCRALMETGCTELALIDLKGEQAKKSAAKIRNHYQKTGLEGNQREIKVEGFECNVAEETSVKDVFEEVIRTFGKLDSVIASAGIVENYPALDYPDDRMRKLFDVNFFGAYYTSREAAKHMIPTGGGSILLISSMSANVVNIPQPQAPYNSSKAAVKHLAASLAVEWARKNIRVNSLSPGYTQTRLTRQLVDEDKELADTWKSLTPMGRLGEPDDISGAAVFLCSEAARFITGTELIVDGGYCQT